MKKILFALLFASVFGTAMAQTQSEDDLWNAYPAEKFSVATNGYWDNWFIQIGADWSAFYSDEENLKELDGSPFASLRATPGFSVAVGKWHTPGLGLRLKGQGVWGRQVWSSDAKDNKTKYFNVQFQPIFNLSNLFYGYKPTRVWNLSLFVGAGVNYVNDFDRLAMSYSCGLNSSWRLNNRFSIFGELGLVMNEHDSDGRSTTVSGDYIRTWRSHDKNIYAEVGLNINLGKVNGFGADGENGDNNTNGSGYGNGRVGWMRTPDLDVINALHQGELDALNAQIGDLGDENDRLKKLLKDAIDEANEAKKRVKDLHVLPVSVFFECDKTVIYQQSDLVDVRTLVEYAKEHGKKLLVTGYADSPTGTEDRNWWLSEARCDVVTDAIVEMGFNRDDIVKAHKGGVVIINPTIFNRRTTVEIAD